MSSIIDLVRSYFDLSTYRTLTSAPLLHHNLVSCDRQCFESSSPSNTFNLPSTRPTPPCKPSYFKPYTSGHMAVRVSFLVSCHMRRRSRSLTPLASPIASFAQVVRQLCYAGYLSLDMIVWLQSVKFVRLTAE